MEFKTIMAKTPLVRSVERLYYQNTYSNQIWKILGKEPNNIALIDGVFIVFSTKESKTFHISKTTLLFNYDNITDRVSDKFLKKLYGKMEATKQFIDLIERSRNVKKK